MRRKKGKILYFDLILIPQNQSFLFETYNQVVSLLGRFLVLKSSFSKSRRGLGGAQIEVLGRWVGFYLIATKCNWPIAVGRHRIILDTRA